MTNEKKVAGIYHGAPFHWVGDGFRVSNYFPQGNNFGEKISPFFLMDYHPPHNYPATQNEHRGVGPHPHRGFETVTLSFAGSVAHQDSAGHSGVIHPGDVQWMTAASGVLHKEYHEKNYAHAGGLFHVAQIWINLPKAHKMDPPRYQGLTAEQIVNVELPNQAGTVRVIAGEYQGKKGPAKTFTPINMFDIYLNAQGKINLSFPATDNTGILVIDGQINVNQKTTAKTGDFVLFENSGEEIVIEASEKSHLL